MGFKKNAIIIAIILLILSLVGIGIALTKATKTKEWPPQLNECPDYWDLVGDKCKNTLNIGSEDCGGDEGINPLQDNTKTSRCERYNEINVLNGTLECNNKISWDGVTNNNDDCPIA